MCAGSPPRIHNGCISVLFSVCKCSLTCFKHKSPRKEKSGLKNSFSMIDQEIGGESL